MATREDKIEVYIQQLESLGEKINKKRIEEITDELGAANYNADASYVSCSDGEELQRIYTNYCAQKLGMEDQPKAMKKIYTVCEKMKDQKKKHRAVFYYLLSK